MRLSRVVWREGMHLAQHHFQLQSGYFEDAIAYALQHLLYKPYGLAGSELDAEALRSGTVSVVHARGVMPDGMAFHFPDADPPPEPRDIQELFSPTDDSHLVFLAIPPYRPGASNCGLEPGGNSHEVRYIAESRQVFDEVTGRDEKVVEVGRKNFQLLVDSELREGLVSLPLARVRRDGTGHFIYDPDYVPPSLQIGASERLMQMLRRLIDILTVKSETIAGKRRADHRSFEEYAAGEVASFWMSHAIQASLAPLRHHFAVRHSRPEDLYTELARLAGALCTFSTDSHPRDLPAYDHDHLEVCFGALDAHIRAHLELLAPTNCLSIPLSPVRAYFHAGKVEDRRCFGAARWIMAVRASVPPEELVTAVPRLVKLCSSEYVARLVKEARPGLTLQHLATPPAAVSPQPGTAYFEVGQAGPCWKAINKGGTVAAYVPSALPEAELQLLIVLETAAR